jgi:methyl-accepting chemotaxis protein
MLANLKIGTKLSVGFGVIMALLVGVGAAGYWSMRQMSKSSDELKAQADTVKNAERLRSDMLQLRRFEKDIFLNIDSAEKVASYKQKYLGMVERYRGHLAEFIKKADEEREREYASSIKQNGQTYLDGFKGVLDGIEAGRITNMVEANVAMGSFKEATHKVESEIADYVVLVQKQEDGLVVALAQAKKMTAAILTGLIAVAFLATVLLATLISRAITGPIIRLAKDAEALANGNLTVLVTRSGRDEIGQLADSFSHMAAKLRATISQIAATSEQVAASSCQLQETAGEISTGAEEVAMQTSAVATASEEMAATSGTIARSCQMAAETSNRASETAQSGVDVVRTTIDGMERIATQVKAAAKTVESLGARSDQIGAIIGTIEEIADQTNLLALNAAIEAARAGDQGRGFAVVADEVRALAERTTRATREIDVMIKSIQKETIGAVAAMEEGVNEVTRGTITSKQSGEALERILRQINDVTMQVNQIATAAEQQTATTSEITGNIQHITQVVFATSKGAAETASASSALSRESEQLQALVGQFTW